MTTRSPFWTFSLAFYGAPGVPAACIALQDGRGVDVNLMLFGLWLAEQGRAVSAGDLAQADAAVADWRAQAVVAIRGARRFLRTPPSAFDATAAAALRERVKAVELESERLQQEALFALRPVAEWGRACAAAEAGENNLDSCAAFYGAPFEAEPRAALLGAFHARLAGAAANAR